MMPPHETPDPPPAAPAPAAEQMMPKDVYDLLRSHIAYAAATRNEVRQARRQQQETDMKVTELSSKVDTLISVATDIKNRQTSVSAVNTGGSAQVFEQDDPEVERLAKRIDDAVAILRGDKSAGSVALDNTSFDPNAPVTPAPSADALATSINAPVDPNAPAV
jgi:hypothetical protein